MYVDISQTLYLHRHENLNIWEMLISTSALTTILGKRNLNTFALNNFLTGKPEHMFIIIKRFKECAGITTHEHTDVRVQSFQIPSICKYWFGISKNISHFQRNMINNSINQSQTDRCHVHVTSELRCWFCCSELAGTASLITIVCAVETPDPILSLKLGSFRNFVWQCLAINYVLFWAAYFLGRC